MSDPPEPQRHTAAVADFTEGGDFHIKTLRGEHLIITLGPAQIISTKRGVDRYVAQYEVAEIAKSDSKPDGIWR